MFVKNMFIRQKCAPKWATMKKSSRAFIQSELL